MYGKNFRVTLRMSPCTVINNILRLQKRVKAFIQMLLVCMWLAMRVVGFRYDYVQNCKCLNCGLALNCGFVSIVFYYAFTLFSSFSSSAHIRTMLANISRSHKLSNRNLYVYSNGFLLLTRRYANN